MNASPIVVVDIIVISSMRIINYHITISQIIIYIVYLANTGEVAANLQRL